ncbi:MAG TPA: MlaD family protein [Tepidisphaeraceae bacterium]|nr:MlaD family protein [Tepidisphaeraceae bacterium]
MNTKRYFKLGLFVLAGVGIIFGTVLALGLGRFLQKRVPAETVMDESVDGLDIGAPVKYRGVNIGSVTSIRFASDLNGDIEPSDGRIARYVVIGMGLDANAFGGMTPLQIKATMRQMTQSGLRARLDQQGIGGGIYVGLDFVEPPPGPSVPIHANSQTLLIPSVPSTLSQVMSAADRLASDVRQANLPKVVEHFDGLITTATGTVQHVDQIVVADKPGIDSAIASLPAITARMKSTAARLDQLVRDDRLNRIIGNATDDSANAGATLAEIRSTVHDMQSLMLSQQEDIEAIVADLRRTADNLAATSGDVRDDPARLLFGQPPPHKEPGE